MWLPAYIYPASTPPDLLTYQAWQEKRKKVRLGATYLQTLLLHAGAPAGGTRLSVGSLSRVRRVSSVDQGSARRHLERESGAGLVMDGLQTPSRCPITDALIPIPPSPSPSRRPLAGSGPFPQP